MVTPQESNQDSKFNQARVRTLSVPARRPPMVRRSAASGSKDCSANLSTGMLYLRMVLMSWEIHLRRSVSSKDASGWSPAMTCRRKRVGQAEEGGAGGAGVVEVVGVVVDGAVAIMSSMSQCESAAKALWRLLAGTLQV